MPAPAPALAPALVPTRTGAGAGASTGTGTGRRSTQQPRPRVTDRWQQTLADESRVEYFADHNVEWLAAVVIGISIGIGISISRGIGRGNGGMGGGGGSSGGANPQIRRRHLMHSHGRTRAFTRLLGVLQVGAHYTLGEHR